MLAPALLVGLQIDANPRFSPVDEAAHLDYVDRVADGDLPRQGQRMLKSTLREVACRGNALEAIEVPRCIAPDLRYEQFPGGRTSTRPSSRRPIVLFAAGFFAAACKATNLLPVAAVSALFAAAAIDGRAPAERWTATVHRWLHDGGALLLGAGIATGAWILVHRALALIELKDEPTFAGLRRSPHGLGVVLGEAATLFQPLTGGFVSVTAL